LFQSPAAPATQYLFAANKLEVVNSRKVISVKENEIVKRKKTKESIPLLDEG